MKPLGIKSFLRKIVQIIQLYWHTVRYICGALQVHSLYKRNMRSKILKCMIILIHAYIQIVHLSYRYQSELGVILITLSDSKDLIPWNQKPKNRFI